MSFFQNVFDQEFQGYLVLGDRQASITYKVAASKNHQSKQIAWVAGPYDLSVTNTLVLNYSWDKEFKIWSSVEINIAGVNASSTTAIEIADKLNQNSTFSDLLVATAEDFNGSKTVTVSKNPVKKQDIKIYFSNSGAETKLKFNKYAGVAEMPNYFQKHTIENRNNYPDSIGTLIKLDEGDEVDQTIIQDAGFSLTPKEDYELLKGRSGLFMFQNITVDGSDRITQVIEYPAGAVAGDFARKIRYSYTSANINPDKVTETPYVLEDVDLVVP